MEGYIEHLVDNTLKKENAKEIISERISWYEMQLKGKQEEIERLHNIIKKVILDIEDVREKNSYYEDYKVDNSILSFWIDILKDSDKE